MGSARNAFTIGSFATFYGVNVNVGLEFYKSFGIELFLGATIGFCI